MNTNQLKRFAQAARKKLLEQIGAKLEYVLTSDSAELREKADQVRQLKTELELTSKAMLVEKVAYTWFNRLVALRFMDVNDYQPTGIRVISPKDGYTLPELLDETKQGNIPPELEVDKKRINDLLDGRIPSTNPQNEVFKLLLIASCNYLHKVFPFLYERINDYTELLLPDDLTSDFSVLQDVREGMSAEDASQVEIIGWLYQFYISEKKDEVFASKEKVKKEDIPAATQLFTPRWIVEYMVQNTLGKLWLQNRPNSKLKEHMPYFIESESLKAKEYLKVSSPEEIKLLDQAVGSGHILVYGFELFTKIYEEEGYNQAEIPSLIIKNNLYGNEIDERAAQLAGLALMMKAREYDRRFFKRSSIPEPNILCFKDLRLQNNELQTFLNKVKVSVSNELWRDLVYMRQATNLGSLLIPQSSIREIQESIIKLENVKISLNAFEEFEREELKRSLRQLSLLKAKYHCVVDNPPYMGGGNMNKELSDFVKDNYPDSKSDLMACFMECGLNALFPLGLLGMINQHSWMFLSSYEDLRKKLIDNISIDSLLHLGPRTFPEIGGEVVQNAAFTFLNSAADLKGVFIRLVDYDRSDLKRDKTLEAISNPSSGWFYTTNQKDFEKISGSPIGYWLGKNWLKIFNQKQISGKAISEGQNITGDNGRYIRYFWEVEFGKVSKGGMWPLIAKGGEIRKWYGNVVDVVNWSDKAREEYRKNSVGRIQSNHLWFREGITWTLVAGAGFRILEHDTLFNKAAPSILFSTEDIIYRNTLLGFLNSKISKKLLEVLNPTLNTNIKEVLQLPFEYKVIKEIESIVNECVDIASLDWNKTELSSRFTTFNILENKGQDLEECYDLYQQYWKNKFDKLHHNEEELNRQFIEIYNLQNELIPEVSLDDITILKEETRIENGQLIFRADEVFAQFMSFAVGCMFGRYSLDKVGLILANQGETLEDYIHKVSKTREQLIFIPDDDNIIPVLDDEWFEDDIVSLFHQFLKSSFGENTFKRNLDFVEQCLGRNIRKYFLKEFHKDHIQRYKKRPIYWMLSSPKEHFNVLIYMHRYTPDTLNIILNNYLREFIEKLKTRKEHLKHIMVAGNATEQNKALKELDKIEEMILDCQEYEREILFPLAAERIAIDLDDGVLVNYNKFGKAVREVQGLNDKKTKKQVKEFDWIDTSQIR